MLIIGKEVMTYAYKMCLHGKPEFILPYHVIQVEEGYDYIIDQSGLKPLWKEETPMMTTETLGKLLLSFVGMAGDCKEYLLDFKGVGLREGDFFLCGQDKVAFSHKPFNPVSDQPLRELLETWLVLLHQHVDPDSEVAMMMLHPLGIALASESLSLEGFAEVVASSVGQYYG